MFFKISWHNLREMTSHSVCVSLSLYEEWPPCLCLRDGSYGHLAQAGDDVGCI